MKRVPRRSRSAALLERWALKMAAPLTVVICLMGISPRLCAQQGGNVLKLGGTNGYVEIPGVAIDDGGPITIEFWSYVSQSDVQESSAFTIGGNGTHNVQAHAPWNDYNLYWDYGTPADGGRLSADYFNYLNRWTHVALVSEGSGGGFKAIYLDGAVAAWDLSSDGPDIRVSGFTIGKNGTLYHRGMIDEFRIWNMVRTDEEIQAGMVTAAQGYESGLMAAYHFDEAPGTTSTADASYNQFNGVLVGDAALISPDAFDPPPHVLSCNRHNPATTVTSATSVTFRITFSEPVTGVDAQDIMTSVAAQLDLGTLTVHAVSPEVYDVTVPVTGTGNLMLKIPGSASISDLEGNAYDADFIGEEYWISQALFTDVTPVSDITVSHAKISYNLTQRIASGRITWTRTGGTQDAGSPHIRALTGNELNAGMHENITFANNPALVHGAIYTITFNGTALDGQALPVLTSTNITFDRNLTPANIDPSFDPGNGAEYIRAMLLQNDGKVVIGGEFDEYNAIHRSRVARLNADGSIDETFTPEDRDWAVNAMLLQGDGNIVLAGDYSNSGQPNIIRLDGNGLTDPGFNPGTGANSEIRSMLLQTDGKILIGGRFDEYNGEFFDRLARLNTDGSIDESFYFDYENVNQEEDLISITSMLLQSDGKIIVAAHVFYGLGGVEEYATRIFRLSEDGAADPTFDDVYVVSYDEEEVYVNTMLLQDGKIVIGGSFLACNGVSRSNIARLNADGTVDESFVDAEIAREDWDVASVNAMLLQDGKIVIGGRFSYCQEELRNNIARLNADGSLDKSFNPLPGADDEINAIAGQGDGNIVIVGDFAYFNGEPRNGIARLDPVLPQVVSIHRYTPAAGLTNQTNVTFRITFSEPVMELDASDFTLVSNGLTAGTPSINAFSSAVYDVTIPQLEGNGTTRLDILTTASVTDLAGNGYFSVFETGEAYAIDQVAPVFSATAPANNATIGNIKVSYSLSEPLSSGTITWTRTGGAADAASPHVQTLTGAMLDAGGHIDITPTGNPALVSQAIYSVSFNGADLAGNAAGAVVNTNVMFDTRTSQLITFGALAEKTFGDAPFTLSATASSGLPITYSSNDPELVSLSGNTATILGAGKVTITAHQEGNDSYFQATAAQELIINKASQVITFETIEDQTVGGNAFALTATSSSGLPVTFSASSDNISVADNQVTIHAAGRVSVMASQSGNDNYNPAIPVEKGFCIRPAKPVITASFADAEHPVLTSSAPADNQWYLNGNAMADATQVTLQVGSAGIYKVQASAGSCLSEFSENFAVLITGVTGGTSAEKIEMYPNPAEDVLRIRGVSAEADLAIIDATGKRRHLNMMTDNQSVMIDVSSLTSGIYVLQATAQGRIRVMKFVKK